MLQKIKDLMKTKEEIDVINKNIQENSKIVSDLKLELESLKRELIENKKIQEEFLKNFKKLDSCAAKVNGCTLMLFLQQVIS